MKITLTLAEIKNIVAAHLGIRMPFEVEIGHTNAQSATILAVFEKARAEMNRGNKIAAIRELRAAAPWYGLWEAKTVVENLDYAVALVSQFNGWPIPTRDINTETLVVWKQRAG